MKKTIRTIYLIAAMISLCACSATPSAQANGNPQAGAANLAKSTTNASSNENIQYLDDSYSNALSVPMQLIIGTLKLQGTDNEVDADTAKQLLTLWKAVKTLSNDDMTSSLEIEALYRQIQRTMTKEQISAISAMKLTRDNMMQILEELGLSTGGGTGMGALTQEQQATLEADSSSNGGFSGGMMGGGPGGGMPGGMPGAGGPPVSSSSSSSSSKSSTPQTLQVDSKMVEALIEYLETRIQ